MKRRIVQIVSVIVLAGSVIIPTLYVGYPGLFSTAHTERAGKPPQPKVRVNGALVHDFGKLPQMQTGSHTLEVKNVGDTDLELWFESSSPSAYIKLATPGANKRTRIKPNETRPIELEWNTKKFVDWYSQCCTIGTNDPTMPTIMLAVKGMVYSAEPK